MEARSIKHWTSGKVPWTNSSDPSVQTVHQPFLGSPSLCMEAPLSQWARATVPQLSKVTVCHCWEYSAKNWIPSPPIHLLKLSSCCDGFWRWYLWEVIVMRVKSPRMGFLMLYYKRPQRAPRPLPLCEDTTKGEPSMNHELDSHQTLNLPVLILDFPTSPTVINKLQFVYKPPSLWYTFFIPAQMD